MGFVLIFFVKSTTQNELFRGRILILEKFDDFFFQLFYFLFFFEKFWMIPNDKYTWEGQIVILSFVTCSLHMKSTIKLKFWQILGFLAFLGFFHNFLAIF